MKIKNTADPLPAETTPPRVRPARAPFVARLAYGPLRLIALLWRCIYPVLASVFLWGFFVVATQGTELLKIFIAGERTVIQHWSLSVGFAFACGTIWWVSRKILLTPWRSVTSDSQDEVSTRWANTLPLGLALVPMILVTINAEYIERTSQSIAATVCLSASDIGCAIEHQWLRPRQVYLFALMTVLLFAVIVTVHRRHLGEAQRTKRASVRNEWGWIAFISVFAFGLWFLFHWSGSTAGEIGQASFFRHQMLAQRTLGAVMIVLVAVVSWTSIGGIVLTIWPKQLIGISLVALPLVLTAVFSGFRHEDNDMRELPPLKSGVVAPAHTISQALAAFHARALEARRSADPNSRAPRDPSAATAPVPIYLVAASGGGLRAAYWSAAVLADLQDQNPEFANHLFLASGVSGGGLGAATFIAGLKAGCPTRIIEGDSAGDCVRRVLEDVPLSPVLAATLYGDFWRSLWPSTWHHHMWHAMGLKHIVGEPMDRAHALEHTWETSFSWCSQRPDVVGASAAALPFPRAFRCAQRPWAKEMPADVAAANTLGLPMHALWPRSGAQNDSSPAARWIPHLIINGTDAATGRRILSSGLRLFPSEFPDAYIARTDDPSVLNSRLSTVIHNGARFPVVSPAGRIENQTRKAVMQPWSPNAEGDDLSTVTAGAEIVDHARLLCSQPVASGINPCRLPAQDVHRIVDGGYFDNSGLSTVRDVLDEIEVFNESPAAHGKPKFRASVIIITNNGWSYAVPTGARTGPVSAIVNAYTRAPEARSAHDLADRINRALPDAIEDTFLFNLDRAGNDVPGLGWALSEASTNQMIVASSHSLYHERVRAALARLDPYATNPELLHLSGAAVRTRRCVFAIAKTSLAPRSGTLCASK